ncbi:HAD-like protein [Tilletiaria anomala UBC 951]|uniref:HAD-like protein n=1 Tax=Tilletiaria anomala (strain ATCC 24038 / CBS 436.72 / UBC 951) TaxID=1037660 RepID=A0A066VVG7_TILAU|nr:HAD-like protein [Tilletiaria anomala UBC 951]KDN45471.1 HAD-like protein [Tilletiaria anomala UBC 951]
MATPTAQVKAVLFDMDGLLIDSEGVYTQVVNDVLRPYGKEQTWEIKAHLMGMPERNAVKTLFQHLWPPRPNTDEVWSPECPFDIDSFLQARNKTLDDAFSKVKPMPGAERLVRHLAAHGVPICIATGSKQRNYKIKSSANPSLFAPFEGRVICGDDPRLTRGKPTPDVFLLAAREGLKNDGWKDRVREPGPQADGSLKGGERDILVFEDAKPGVQAGLAAGMNVVWVPDPNLKALYSGNDLGAHQTLDSLLDFKPEEWGLPPFPLAN